MHLNNLFPGFPLDYYVGLAFLTYQLTVAAVQEKYMKDEEDAGHEDEN